MARPLRFLGVDTSSTTTVTTAPSAEQPGTLGSHVVVTILAALLCVLGLIRCALLRRLSSSVSSTAPPPPAFPSAANKGSKKMILHSLPTQTLSAESIPKFSDCTICLTELAAGDEIRILPQCGHGFHVSCIDMWLCSHLSCPSCRLKCGGVPAFVPASSSGSGGESEARVKHKTEIEFTRLTLYTYC